ncbi:MAG: sulfatase [Myxococcota bacterium]
MMLCWPVRRASLGLVFLLMTGCGSGQDRGGVPADGARPNIILITIESLRADHVGAYGYQRDTTPALDALSAEAVTFDRAYSVTSWTLPSHASIFTGMYPTAHQVQKPFDRLDGSYQTLAELLQRGGYQTAGIVSGPFLRATHNLNQGFEIYDESAIEGTSFAASHETVTNPRVEERVKNYLTKGRDPERPFFLFIYLWDPHYDYIPPPPYDQMFVPASAEKTDVRHYESPGADHKILPEAQLQYVISQYDGEIRWTDELLGRLWYLLRELDLWDRTGIIATSDHGEEFFEHGVKGHKNNLYVQSLHVPLIVKAAGSEAPRRDARVVNLIDLYPTLLAMAGQAVPASNQGSSLLAPAAEPPPPVFFELEKTSFYPEAAGDAVREDTESWLAAIDGDYKMVARSTERRPELFDLANDPEELHPLGGGYLEKALDLSHKIKAHQVEMIAIAAGFGKEGPAELTPDQIERLRALGYVGPKQDPAGP